MQHRARPGAELKDIRMPLACPQCQTQNADGARFCRACGTTLGTAPPPAQAAAAAATGITCDDCGHLNAAGTRYCAKCGYSLVGTVIVSRRDSALGALAPAADAPAAPPRSSGRPRLDEDSDSFDPLSAPTQAMHMGAAESSGGRFSQMAAQADPGAAAPVPPSRTGLWIVLGVLALLVLGGGGWWLMKPAAPAAEAVAAPPAATPAPAEPPPAAPPVVASPAPDPAPVPVPVPVEPPAAVPPVAAAPEPAPAAPPPAAAPDAAREAAQRAAREKAARDRAEREARAKALVEQRAQEERARAAAAQAAARPAPPPAAPAPAPAAAAAPVVRSVKEACAGRNLISQGLCEQRECRKPENADQAVCRQIKEAEQRRLYQ
jgi:hypothetical protein